MRGRAGHLAVGGSTWFEDSSGGVARTPWSIAAWRMLRPGADGLVDLADAYLAAAALEIGPAAVASFDTDFDTVEGVRRITD